MPESGLCEVAGDPAPSPRAPIPLRRFVVAYSLLLTLPLLAALGWALSAYVGSEQVRLEKQAEETLRDVQEKIDTELASMAGMVDILSGLAALDVPDPTAFERQARRIAGERYSSVLLFDASGRLMAGTAGGGREAWLARIWAAITAASPGGADVFVSDLLRDERSGTMEIAVSRRIVHDGAPLVLAVTSGIGPFVDLLDRQNIVAPFYSTLVDGTGMVLARSADRDRYTGTRLPNFDKIVGPSGSAWVRNLQGIEVLGLYRRLTHARWYVGLGVARDALYAALWHSIAVFFGVLAGLSAAALTLGGLLLRWLARVLDMLALNAERLGRGEPVAPTGSRVLEADEIGAALVRGSHELRRREAELTALNGELEERVRLRTNALLEEQQRLTITLASMDQGLIMVGADDHIRLWNGRAVELLGLPPDLLEGDTTSSDILNWQKQSGEFAHQTEMQALPLRPDIKATNLTVYERERPNGQVLEIRTSPMPGGGAVRTYSDVTARRSIDRALRQSERRYRELAETTTDVITRLNLNFERTYVSPAITALLGFTPEELVGSQPFHAVHPDDADKLREGAEALVANGPASDQLTITYRKRHRDGRWVWLEAGMRLLCDEHQQPLEIACSLRDVSERQRIAEQLERARRNAERAQDEAQEARRAAEIASQAKTDFLANMSHEMRTPLNGILGMAELVLADDNIAAGQRERLGKLRYAADALRTVVDDILDFSSLEAGRIEIHAAPFGLVDLVELATDIVRPLADAKGLHLTVRVPPPLRQDLLGDANRIRQILLNLLNNAVKFTTQGGIDVELAIVERPGLCRVRLTVHDTGIGISADKMPSLFDRFTQVDSSARRAVGGTGLGLAISRRLAEAMGGRIEVDSVLGTGSAFTLQLDLPAVARFPERRAPAPAASSRALRILLAEDYELNREVAESLLAAAGHHVVMARDGVEAVAAVQREEFDLVLMDIHMPNMDGVTASEHIRALGGRASTLPIVALTANVLPQEIARLRDRGLDDHLGKPFRGDELHAMVARWSQGRSPRSVDHSPVTPALDELIDVLGIDRVRVLVQSLAARLHDLSQQAEGGLPLARETAALVADALSLGCPPLDLTPAGPASPDMRQLADLGIWLDRVAARLDVVREPELLIAS